MKLLNAGLTRLRQCIYVLWLRELSDWSQVEFWLAVGLILIVPHRRSHWHMVWSHHDFRKRVIVLTVHFYYVLSCGVIYHHLLG